MATGTSWTKSLFTGLWSFLNFLRNAFFNIIFLIIAIVLISAFMSGEEKVLVPSETALVLDLVGDVVIQKEAVDPFQEFIQEAFEQREDKPEVLLSDVIFAINNAKEDKRIKTLVLDLQNLGHAGLNKLEQISAAIDDFKQSGKPVYAIGDYYSQNQYYLAAHADHLYLNPMGSLLFEGYGRYGMYFKTALEKLKATTHVFRVGTYKSYVEPYIRDDMSDAAKQANQAWLDAMWRQYKTRVAEARGVPVNNFDEELDLFLTKFEQANGNFANYALQNNWVDALKTRQDVLTELTGLVGKSDDNNNKRGYTNIGFKDYLDVITSPFPHNGNGNNVAIVVAKGEILNGFQKPGTIGGDSTAQLLRKARMDDTVKAVVLYVDSPGGSAFASEVIRQEIENLKAAGKPVVAQMSSVAASGGYWISASADQIWAAPSTITGSIGIFGMFMTFENTLDYLGVHTDGVGTTEFAGLSATRALDPRVGAIFQRSIENGYEQFISMVAEERDMSKEQVDSIAQGRVWIGEKAQEIGLVDHLGYLSDSVAAAAELAGLEKYDTKDILPDISAKEKFWRELFGKAANVMGGAHIAQSENPQFMTMIKQLLGEFDSMTKLNDPQGIYAFCIACEL
ncbi:signal peptide peptidase SppA [Neptunicella sp. SCSIO 80796]|uniref:signal peptide peptidase SppA n=1 Tax=Neptunicella plasticusilytica TaxID=3117012 RepID=UPI003A4E2891